MYWKLYITMYKTVALNDPNTLLAVLLSTLSPFSTAISHKNLCLFRAPIYFNAHNVQYTYTYIYCKNLPVALQ